MKLDPSDPRLTAYALGELSKEERAATRRLLRQSPAARKALQEIRETAASLTDELGKEPSPRLSEIDRLVIEASVQGAPNKRKRRFPWVAATIAAGLVLTALAYQFVGRVIEDYEARRAFLEQSAGAGSPQQLASEEIPVPDASELAQKPVAQPSSPAGTKPEPIGARSPLEPPPRLTTQPEQSGAGRDPLGVEQKPSEPASVDVVSWIDRTLAPVWKENELVPSKPASDGEFVRRAYLDIVGHIPPAQKTVAYIRSRDRDKKAKLIRWLLDSEEYPKYWADVWADLLVGRRPGRNVDTDSLKKYLRESFAENKPWNQMVYELITATGGSMPQSVEAGVGFNGATNFLLAHLNDEKVPATAYTARLFLGVQLQCTQCHDHPFNDRTQEAFWGINACFQQMRREVHNTQDSTGKRRFRFADLQDVPLEPEADLFVRYDRRDGFVAVTPPRLLDGKKYMEGRLDLNLRAELARSITAPENEYFAKAIVNRLWAHFLGTGIVYPMDDLGEHNPPSIPELLDGLAQKFTESNYDLKQLITWITSSRPYGLSSRTNRRNQDDEQYFSHFLLKQMSPGQLFVSLMIASRADRVGAGSWEDAPQLREDLLERFTIEFQNDENTEADTFNGTIPQALLMMNDRLIERATSTKKGSYLRERVERIVRKRVRGAGNELLNDLYLAALSRSPTEREKSAVLQLLRESQARGQDRIEVYQDVFWALLNSSEFVLNH